jgi:hypothetical protein
VVTDGADRGLSDFTVVVVGGCFGLEATGRGGTFAVSSFVPEEGAFGFCGECLMVELPPLVDDVVLVLPTLTVCWGSCKNSR